MGAFGRGNSQQFRIALLVAAAAAVAVLALVSGASAGTKPAAEDFLKATTRTLTVGATTGASCIDRRAAAGTPGASTTRWTAPADGYTQFRLTGAKRNDWDLALFDAKTGRRVDASAGFDANELAQAWVRRGQSLDVQACRLKGSSAVARLTTQPVAIPLAKPGTAPKLQLVSIPLHSRLDFATLTRTGLNLDEVPNGNKAIAVLAGPADAAKITKAGFTYKVLDGDMAASERRYRQADARRSAKAAGSPLPSGRTLYRNYPEIQADLKKVVQQHPAIAKPITLPGKTFQGREQTSIEVTSNVNAKDDGKPTFWLMGTHHAREWPAAEIPTEFALYVTSLYGKDKRVTNLLKRVRIVITPVINVDGYIASRSDEAFDPADQSGDPGGAPSTAEIVGPPGGTIAYRRKNCDGESPSPATPCELQYGIDNNRNYGEGWGGPGASTNPDDQDYRGSGMWSEPENQAVWHFSQHHDVTTLITMHNFASLVLRPPGRHNDGLAPDETALKKLGDRMARDTGYTSEYGFQLYDTSGTTEDWNYGAAGTFGYTIEMGPDSQHNGNFHVAYKDAVEDQWTGAKSLDGKGKGLRDALLAAGEAAADRQQFGTLRGNAPPGALLRLHKSFNTFSSDICSAETTGYDCDENTPRLGQQSRPDMLDYTTTVPGSGRYSWIVTPSTRPFELKKGKTEQWTLTCEDPVSHRVITKRLITLDRGQTLTQNLCGAKPTKLNNGCVDKRKLRLHVDKPHRGHRVRIFAYVNGKRVKKLSGKAARRGTIRLKRLRAKRGTYKVTIVTYVSTGSVTISKRTYRGCKKSAPHTIVKH